MSGKLLPHCCLLAEALLMEELGAHAPQLLCLLGNELSCTSLLLAQLLCMVEAIPMLLAPVFNVISLRLLHLNTRTDITVKNNQVIQLRYDTNHDNEKDRVISTTRKRKGKEKRPIRQSEKQQKKSTKTKKRRKKKDCFFLFQSDVIMMSLRKVFVCLLFRFSVFCFV